MAKVRGVRGGKTVSKPLTSKQVIWEQRKLYVKSIPTITELKNIQTKTPSKNNKKFKKLLKHEIHVRQFKKKQLREQNRKRFGNTSPFSTSHIEETNEIIRAERINTEVARQQGFIYRYSVGFYSNDSPTQDITIRGEVYTVHPQNHEDVAKQLVEFVKRRIKLCNRRIQTLFYNAKFLGLEHKEVGDNDLGKCTIGVMHFYID